MLEVDKNSICNIPSVSPSAVYIRTGVPGDGSCFYHAFLKATNHQYKYKSVDDRRAATAALREKIASKVDDASLAKIGGGQSRHMLFFAELSERIARGFPEDADYKTFTSLVDLQKILQETTSFKTNFYFTFIEKVNAVAAAQIPLYESRYKSLVHMWCYKLFLKTNESLRAAFKRRILEDQVDALQIGFIAAQLQYNFLFLQEGEDGALEPYPLTALVDGVNKYVILLWKDQCHYEPIGLLKQNKRAKRIFNADDELVQAILNK